MNHIQNIKTASSPFTQYKLVKNDSLIKSNDSDFNLTSVTINLSVASSNAKIILIDIFHNYYGLGSEVYFVDIWQLFFDIASSKWYQLISPIHSYSPAYTTLSGDNAPFIDLNTSINGLTRNADGTYLFKHTTNGGRVQHYTSQAFGYEVQLA